jgi:HSP20 family protein
MVSMTAYPWHARTRRHREMDQLFNRVWTGSQNLNQPAAFTPASEVLSSNDGWHVRLALPGVDPAHAHIDVAGSTLTVSGERVPAMIEGDVPVREIPYGRFERTFSLLDAIDAEKVSASYRDGMLEIALPLKESAKRRRIEIATDDQRKALKHVA